MVRRFRAGSGLFVDGGRVTVYACLAVGLVAGSAYAGMFDASQAQVSLLGICSLSIVLLVGTSLVPSFNQDGYADVMAQAPSLVEVDADDASRERAADEALSILCETCSTSESCSIRPAIAASLVSEAGGVGKQQACAKGEAPQPKASAVVSALVTEMEALEIDRERMAAQEVEGASSQEQAWLAACADGTQDDAASARKAPGADEQAFAQSPAKPSRNQAPAQPAAVKTPYRSACREIAELYHLSPRETEIFMLISKGRNAEYVQKELVISIHTAKTHIANIYHKLGVHSVQEMLTLIETFRDERERRESRQGELRQKKQ